MDFLTIPPTTRLAGVINFFWMSRHSDTDKKFSVYYSIAETYAKLVFMYKLPFGGGDDEYYSTLQGQTETHERFPTPGTFEIFGVSLLPGAIPRLFGFPSPDIHNLMFDMPTLFGRRGSELDEQMASAANTPERLNLVSSFLEYQLEQNDRKEAIIDSAIREIKTNGGLTQISALAQKYFLSQKQFKRRFRERSGFTPKTFARITRFEAAIAGYPSFDSLTEMALACGYFDQSHFIRDFREFAGYTPKQYFSLAAIQDNL